MVPQEYLLTDEQMQRFIAHGYLILKTDFPDSFHETLQNKIETIVDKEGNPNNNKVRNHHNWWAMIFYYPQNTVEEMGPSAILPRTQYYSRRVQSMEEEFHLTGDAGTFALIHYDLWHKGTANMSNRNRSMMKFQFVRMDAPSTHSWNHQDST